MLHQQLGRAIREADFSRSTGVAFRIHILETRVQRETGSRLYGKRLIQLMADLDALT